MSYGLIIRNAYGNPIFTMSSRKPHFALSGFVSVPKGTSTTIYVTGMQNNDEWSIFYGTPTYFGGANNTTTTTKYNGYFTITNNSHPVSGLDWSSNYWVIQA